MPTFDVTTFARGLVAPARDAVAPFVPQTAQDAREVMAQYDLLEKAIDSTLSALELVNDPRIHALLVEDLERYLPARRDALLALIANKLGSDAQGAAEAVLSVVVKAAVIAAKAFVVAAVA